MGGRPSPDLRDRNAANILDFGERTYHNLPRLDGGEGPVTFSSRDALKAHCRAVGCSVHDVD